MGTNYYAHVNICYECGKAERVLHIGKSSGGWTFSFRGYRPHLDINTWETDDLNVTSFDDYKELLSQNNTKIIDEYGTVILYDEFIAIVESKKDSKFNHAHMVKERDKVMFPFGFDQEYYDKNWLDEDGNSFTAGEFS
jgi:hypothetical protein